MSDPDLITLTFTFSTPIDNFGLMSLAGAFSLGGFRVSMERDDDRRKVHIFGTPDQVDGAAEFFRSGDYEELIKRVFDQD